MAKSFSSQDAKRLAKLHRDLLGDLENARSVAELYRSIVDKAADRFVGAKVINILRDVPVEEVNRDRIGIRVKTLRAAGYESVADLAAASQGELIAVNGISEDSAGVIDRVVDELAAETRSHLKIQLSLDDQSKEATDLVQALYQYRSSLYTAFDCRILLEDYRQDIETAIENLTPSFSGLRWLFTAKANRQKAIDAYQYLEELYDGHYSETAKEKLRIIDDVAALQGSDAWQAFSKNPVPFFNDLEEIKPGVLGNDDSLYGLPEELAREIQDQSFFPDGLLCVLRRYQEWGVKYILHQKRVLLGDEMGLGKTVQAIAAMVSLRNTGATHFVVICPAGVLPNWQREISRMSKLSVTKVHGSGRLASLSSWIKSGGVALTTYETAAWFKLPEDFSFSLLVADEAHYLKNPNAKRTICVKQICVHAERLLFMTGTALENRADEMITLIGMLQPDIAARAQNMTFMATAPQFRTAVAPVYYRRKREDVLTELPDLIQQQEWVTMNSAEEKAYERAVLSQNYMEARRVSWNVDNIEASSKGARLLELVDEAASDGRKIIVFSFFLDTIQKVIQLLGDRCTPPINGSVSAQRRQEIIDDFEKAPAGTVLPAQIQSGGTGLNIQAASVVIICEPQLKPSIENQAISRAYRMGQARNVLVYRLLCDDSIDERIMRMLEEKQAVFDAFADQSVAAAENMELDNQNLSSLIQEEIDRITAKNGNI